MKRWKICIVKNERGGDRCRKQCCFYYLRLGLIFLVGFLLPGLNSYTLVLPSGLGFNSFYWWILSAYVLHIGTDDSFWPFSINYCVFLSCFVGLFSLTKFDSWSISRIYILWHYTNMYHVLHFNIILCLIWGFFLMAVDIVYSTTVSFSPANLVYNVLYDLCAIIHGKKYKCH